MPAAYTNIYIEQGATFSTSITLDDVYGDTYNLMGYTANSQIRKSYYSANATATFSTSAVLSAMVGTHVLIGIGEALITGLTVSAVLASRSDLVYGWKNNVQKLEIRSAN